VAPAAGGRLIALPACNTKPFLRRVMSIPP
jgi:hypothetical protein